MKVAIMQPYFLPYIGYFQLINIVDTYVFYDDVNYINKGWINRNNILFNGEKKMFSISLNKASQNKLINEIEIKDDFYDFLKTIHCAYSKAPFYKEVFPLLEEICNYSDKNLAVFNANSIVRINEYLGIQTNYVFSSQIEKNNHLKGQEKIIEIIKKLNAQQYINAIGGQFLYDKNEFDKYEIKLNFIETQPSPYKQFKNVFIPYLSIIDVLMFNSVEDINKMLDKFILI